MTETAAEAAYNQKTPAKPPRIVRKFVKSLKLKVELMKMRYINSLKNTLMTKKVCNKLNPDEMLPNKLRYLQIIMVNYFFLLDFLFTFKVTIKNVLEYLITELEKVLP